MIKHGFRIEITEAAPVGSGVPDYADAFAIARAASDRRTAEEWARCGFNLPTSSRRMGMLAHRHLLGFRLGPWRSPEHIFGWRIVLSQPDLLQLDAIGNRMHGHILWRVEEQRVVMTTFVHFQRRATAALVWQIAGPIHRRSVPGLLGRAASGFC